MRQRKIPGLEEKLLELSDYIEESPEALRGKWGGESQKDVYVELGCGKGKFVCENALWHPERQFLAIEGQRSVAWYALRNVKRAKIENVRFILQYIDDIREIFEKDEVAGLYLNFSDPWPKARHAKRRLTFKGRLETYVEIIRPGGIIEFKTDNDDLFDYSMTQIYEVPELGVDYLTRDLHRDVDPETIITTEYEEKFSSRGKNINFVRLIVEK